MRLYDLLVPLTVRSEAVSGATGREETVLDMVRCTLTCNLSVSKLVLSSKRKWGEHTRLVLVNVCWALLWHLHYIIVLCVNEIIVGKGPDTRVGSLHR